MALFYEGSSCIALPCTGSVNVLKRSMIMHICSCIFY